MDDRDYVCIVLNLITGNISGDIFWSTLRLYKPGFECHSEV